MLKNNLNIEPPGLLIFLKYIFFSIIFIHLFGLFGIFFAFAYPLWWFFAPNQAFCFYCFHASLIKKGKGYCPVCKRTTTSIYDPPLHSALINTATIFVLSLFAFLVVFTEVKLIEQTNFSLGGLFRRERTSFILPEKYKFYLGHNFDFDIEVKNPEKPVNVVQSDIQFDKDFINVDSIQTEQSFATIFTQKDFSNDEGWIRIVGGLPNPGFIGEKGLFARISFKPIKPGVGRVVFLPSSRILANDGKGTNLLARFPSQSFVIEPEKKVLGEEIKISLWERLKNYFSFLFR